MSENNNSGSNKSFLKSWTANTPEGWAQSIIASCADAHLKAWAASIIIWDFDGSEDVSALEDIANGYDREQSHRPTSDIVAMLASIGYDQPERRCILREDARIDVKRRCFPQFHKLRNRRNPKQKWMPVEYSIGRLYQ